MLDSFTAFGTYAEVYISDVSLWALNLLLEQYFVGNFKNVIWSLSYYGKSFSMKVIQYIYA